MALALLGVPTTQALDALPELRRTLPRADDSLSPVFWDSAAAVLADIDGGRASEGAVRRWLESTGTEPIGLIGGGFAWPDADERGPVGREMHARLVAHLEGLVQAGDIDADGLAAGHDDAWQAYEQAQLTWLTSPLPDGRTPMWAVDDEDTDAFLAAWDEADADAAEILRGELSTIGQRRCPVSELRAECARLRRLLPDGAWPYDLLQAASGLDATALPADDRELWLALAGGVVVCQDDVPGGDDEAVAAWYALDHLAWIGAVATLARAGPGAGADADSLAHYAAAFDPGDDDAVGAVALEFGGDATHDDEVALELGFQTVTLLWRALGAIDVDERLTHLGWWGVPDATVDAWSHDPEPWQDVNREDLPPGHG